MADIAEEEIGAGLAGISLAPDQIESDFSPRKLKIAFGIIMGQTFATSILPYMAMGFVLIPMTHELGWSRTEYSVAGSALFFFGALSLWPIGRIADKFGVRPVLLAGTIIVGLVTIALSMQTKSLAMFYAIYALLGVFGSTGVTYMKVIAALFTQNRGKAMAILGAEATIVGAGIPVAVSWLLTNYGWRTLYLICGGVILAIVPILFLTLEEPGEQGIRFGLRAAPNSASKPKVLFDGDTIWQAIQEWPFWVITLAILSSLFMLTGMAAHMVPAIIGKGFTQAQAAWVTSLTMFAGFAGTLAGGWAVDHIQTPKVAAPFSFIAAIGAVLLLLVTVKWGGMPVLIASVALGGFSFFAFRPMGSYLQTRFFGLRSFTEIMGVQFMITNVASAGAPTLVGYIYDTTHSYSIAFYLMIGCALLGTVCWAVLPKYRYAANIGQMVVRPTAPSGSAREAHAPA